MCGCVCVCLCVCDAGKMPFKVVVIGGGVSGLVAARQLMYFGLEVTVVESRVSEWLGGRMCMRPGRQTSFISLSVCQSASQLVCQSVVSCQELSDLMNVSEELLGAVRKEILFV